MDDSKPEAKPARRHREWFSVCLLVVREAVKAFSLNRNAASAATLAHYGFLSLMPLLLLVVFLLGLFVQSSAAVLESMQNLVARLFPGFSQAILRDLLALAQRKAWGVVSVAVLVWSAVPFAAAIRDTMAGIFKSDRKLPFLKAKLLDLAAVLLLLALFVFLAAGRMLHDTRIVESLSQWRILYSLWQTVGTLALTIAILWFFYAVFSPVRVRWPLLLVGAATATALLAVIRPVFALVLRVNPAYGYAFGSLKAVFVLTVWVYYTFAVVLFGAEIIAAVRRKEALLLKGFLLGQAAGSKGTARLLDKFTRTCAENEVLFREGEPGSDMYYVLSGAVLMTKGGRDLAVMKPGAYFGEMSMLLHAPRTATARVTLPGTRLVTISQRNFETILRENPEIVRSILKEMALRLQATDEKVWPGSPTPKE